MLLFLAIGGVSTYYYKIWILDSNTLNTEDYELLIPRSSSFEDVKLILERDSILKNYASFAVVSKLMKYDLEKVPSGRYVIKPDWTNRRIVSKLRSGNQDALKLTISTARTFDEIATQLGERLELSSEDVMGYYNNKSFIDSLGFTSENFISLFIPNTYEVYWNVYAEDLISRMFREYERFWSQDDRQAKLLAIGLSQLECSTLASIVEKESNYAPERPIIAGVYLNRIKQGIPLQADPTVVFGVGDFSIRRVLNKHLAQKSPYNTYINRGLPPGPICMPSISSLDAVLNAQSHEYIFFCAKPGYDGQHSFARNNAEHEKNAQEYRKWLTSEGIMK